MPHRLYAKGPEQLTGPIVVDSSIGHGPIRLQDILEINIALRSYERGKHAFGVLLTGAFSDVANDYANNNLIVFKRGAIANKPPNIAMNVQAVYPGTKKADMFSEIFSQE